ncbi:MAG: Gfo/Idh/MocA family oxidoreductase, partial [Candidatus Saccharimonas sp.]|nr:Gfo/Idh/MocA family oxidoreductase [Planctomycetaceae bacterium]
VQLIEVETKSIVREIAVKSGQVRTVAFSPDGKVLATGSYQSVSLWNPVTGELVKALKGHRAYVTGIAFSPDGLRLATACEDEIARVWKLEGDDAPLTFKQHRLPVTGVAWSPDGKLLATSAGDDTRPTKGGEVKIWDAATGEVQQSFELHTKGATGVAFSPDGGHVASSGIDEHVNVYDLKAKKALGFFAGHSRPTNGVLFHPDEETVISISGGRAVGKNELKIWEFVSGEELATAEAHEGRIAALALSKDGRTLATGGYDKSVALWNVGFLAIGLPEVAAALPAQNADATPPADALVAQANAAQAAAADKVAATELKPLRAGIIGLDTSHCGAFAKTLNANPQKPEVAGVRMVAAYPKGSPDIKASVERVPAYTEEMKKLDVEIVDTIDDLLTKVDIVFLETNDGRPHLEQYIPVARAGKPCFIDKPIAGSLADAIAIFEVSKKYKSPVFSSSSLRFGKTSLAVRGGSLGKVLKCETTSPANLEATHPDLFWYGIHGVEALFTVMGTGCQSVTRGKTEDGKIEVTGKWSGDRVGIFREGKGYVGTAVGEKGESPVGSYDGYDPLLFEIIKFARTGQPPVSEAETLEIYAFMEAADESKRQNGASVTLESVMTKARAEAAKKLAVLK